MPAQTFYLVPTPPFRLDLTAWALRRRPLNTTDRWDGESWRRVLAISEEPLEVAVTQQGARLLVTLSREARQAAAPAIERTLGLGADLGRFYRMADGDRRLGPLARRFRGLKPPRFPSVFEALANAIVCQQLSLTVGLGMLNRLTARFGAAGRAFPRPEDVAGAPPEELVKLGLSRAKARALLEAAGGGDLEGLAALDDEEALGRLLAMRGVGRWTAEYVLLRGLGRTHIFPGDDVGARNLLARWLGRREPLDYAGVERALRRWRPFGGLVYFHMLLHGLEAAGQLR